MESQKFVDGEGWISSDSSLYGDGDLSSTSNNATINDERLRHQHKPSSPSSSSQPTMKQTRKLIQQKLQFGGAMNTNTLSRTSSIDTEQSSSQESDQSMAGTKTDGITAQAVRFNGIASAWQQTETIDEFLNRVPVESPKTSSVGPWLWVYDPSFSRCVEPETTSLINTGSGLLQTFEQESKVKTGKRQSKLQLRDKLRDDILSSAVTNNVTFGKWMLFPDHANLSMTWKSIAEATAAGQLGPTAKVATYTPGERNRLICVYTNDFQDIQDVKRVLFALEKLKLISRDGSPIYYKCDAYTYLGIESKNPYGLKASLYSSKELFAN